MSAHYSKFVLNTYAGTPYFQAHIPAGYPIYLVLQKSRAFRRLPRNIKQLAELAKRWALLHEPEDAGPRDIDRWYDDKGNELDPDTGRRLTDAEIDSGWNPDPSLASLTVRDIPIPPGGFADPDVWEPEEPEPEKPDPEDIPTREQLLRDIATRGRKDTAAAYGIPEDELPHG